MDGRRGPRSGYVGGMFDAIKFQVFYVKGMYVIS